MTAAAYDEWDRSAAAARALNHADTSSSRDAGGGIWNFAFGSNMSASKVAFFTSLFLTRSICACNPRRSCCSFRFDTFAPHKRRAGAQPRHKAPALTARACMWLALAFQPQGRLRKHRIIGLNTRAKHGHVALASAAARSHFRRAAAGTLTALSDLRLRFRRACLPPSNAPISLAVQPR